MWTQTIATFLDVVSLVRTIRVCKAWKKHFDTDEVWIIQLKKNKSWRRDIAYPRREWNQLPKWPKTLFIQRYSAVKASKITLCFSGMRGNITLNVPLTIKTSDLVQECASLLNISQPFGIIISRELSIIPSNIPKSCCTRLLDWIGFETACRVTSLNCKIAFEIPPFQNVISINAEDDNRLEEIQRLLDKSRH